MSRTIITTSCQLSVIWMIMMREFNRLLLASSGGIYDGIIARSGQSMMDRLGGQDRRSIPVIC